MHKIFLPLLLLTLVANPAHAEKSGYFSLGIGATEFEDEASSVNPVNLYFRLGIPVTDFLDVGAELSTTAASDEFNNLDFELDVQTLFLKGTFGVTDSINLFGLVGLSKVELTAVSGGTSASTDDSDISFGFGVEIGAVEEGYFYTIDYIRYFDGDEYDGVDIDVIVDSFNFGVAGYF
ncbi:MAG: outer membrane beta-barrel protein [Pseudomonadota bacterium]